MRQRTCHSLCVPIHRGTDRTPSVSFAATRLHAVCAIDAIGTPACFVGCHESIFLPRLPQKGSRSATVQAEESLSHGYLAMRRFWLRSRLQRARSSILLSCNSVFLLRRRAAAWLTHKAPKREGYSLTLDDALGSGPTPC